MGSYNNRELNNYVARIKLSQDKKQSYTSQIDNLKQKVLSAIGNIANTKVVSVRRAGSWKKGTALAPRHGIALDVDMVFYIKVDEDTKFDAESLRKEIIDVLCAAYPNKLPGDFTNGKKTVGIVFRGSGLEVDIVPFIPEKGNTTYGRQPTKKLKSGEFKTSVDKQLNFTIDVKKKCSNYTSIVRILKSWRNFNELELSSFTIELVVAHLIVNEKKNLDSIEYAIIQFFELLGSGRPLSIGFPQAINRLPGRQPWIADPTNNENNTLQNVSDYEWREIQQKAEIAFETISYASVISRKEMTIQLWKDVFGPHFNVSEV